MVNSKIDELLVNFGEGTKAKIKEAVKTAVEEKVQKELKKRRRKMIRNIICVGAAVACGYIIYKNSDKIKKFLEDKASELPKIRLSLEK
ncbi:MAG: hypothetical protein IJL30_04800 [Clostridia bacterium]|nr:hypothetical protein [Clostridia bacterium]